jgi:hypothetical protein
MQITNDAAEPGELVPFQAKTEVRSPSRKLFVRVQDLAGNFSVAEAASVTFAAPSSETPGDQTEQC